MDSDFDDPIEGDGDSMQSQPGAPSDVLDSPQRQIRAYVVKFTAYRTLVAESHEARCTTNKRYAVYAR